MRCISVLILALFFISILSQPLWAQELRKVAYINVSKVLDNYNKTIEADKKLTGEGEKKNKERDKLVDEINKLRDEAELLSREVREKKEHELNEKIRALQDFDRETRLNLQRKRDDIMREIFKEIGKVIKDYGKDKGYDIIFDDRVLLYSDDSLDITDDIIKTLNK